MNLPRVLHCGFLVFIVLVAAGCSRPVPDASKELGADKAPDSRVRRAGPGNNLPVRQPDAAEEQAAQALAKLGAGFNLGFQREVRREGEVVYILNLWGTELTSQQYQELLPPLKHLQELYLGRAGFGDSDVKLVAGLKELRVLDLQDNYVTDEGLKELAATNPKIRWLRLDGTAISEDGLRILAEFPELDTIYYGDARLTNRGVKTLGTLTQLHELSIYGSKVTDEGMKEIGRINELRRLNVAFTEISDQGFKELLPLTKLEIIHLDETRVTDASLKQIAQFPRLRTLLLGGTKISDESLPEILKLKELRWIGVRGTQISQNGVDRLRRAYPEAQIDFN